MKNEREQKIDWLSRSKILRMRLIGLRAEHTERLSRADYTGISHSNTHGGSGNETEGRYIALAETEAEMLAVQQELDRVEAEIRVAIEQVQNPIYQTYLRMRFLAYKSERQIAEAIGYSMESVDGHIRRKSIDAVKLNGK